MGSPSNYIPPPCKPNADLKAPSFEAGPDPARPLHPLPERLRAEEVLSHAVLDLGQLQCSTAVDLAAALSQHGLHVLEVCPANPGRLDQNVLHDSLSCSKAVRELHATYCTAKGLH